MTDGLAAQADARPVLLVLASTYPRYAGDPEPGFVHELCRRLVTQFRVVAVVPDAPGADPNGVLDGVDVIRYRYAPRRLQTLVNDGGIVSNLRRHRWKWLLLPSFMLGQAAAARSVTRSVSVAVIHAHWLLPQGLLARLLGRGRTGYAVTSHGGDLYGLRGRMPMALKRWVVAGASRVSIVSAAMREELSRLGSPQEPACVLPMGVSLRERFVPDGTPRDADRLLFVGRLVPKKGLKYLLAAMPAVLAKRPGVKLDIAGFGPERSNLEADVRRLGLQGSVTFLGACNQDALPGLYRRASLFVAPFIREENGDQEGLPVAMMEAIGCGCPALAGNVAGLEELFGPHARDILVDPRDTASFAHAILGVLADPEAAARIAREVREQAVGTVDWDTVAAGYAAMLMQVVDRGAAA